MAALAASVGGCGTGVSNAWVEFSKSGTPIRMGAQTDADGNYSLLIADGTYQVNAYKPGFIMNPAGIVVDGNETLDLSGTITTTVISGIVQKAGEPVPYAFVSADRAGGGSSATQADADGTFSLPVNTGVWTVDR